MKKNKDITVGDITYDYKYGSITLPHQCGEWRIGKPKDLKKFLEDGKKLLALINNQEE